MGAARNRWRGRVVAGAVMGAAVLVVALASSTPPASSTTSTSTTPSGATKTTTPALLGGCRGTPAPRPCLDHWECDGVAWVPIYLPAGSACDDRNACTFNDTCQGGSTCTGTPISCTSDVCNTRTCNGTSACAVTPRTGASCSDGNACNGAETCDASGVCRSGVPPAVDDGNPCTTDWCDPIAGVQHAPITSACCSAGAALTTSCCSAGSANAAGSPCVGDVNGATKCNGLGACVASTLERFLCYDKRGNVTFRHECASGAGCAAPDCSRYQ